MIVSSVEQVATRDAPIVKRDEIRREWFTRLLHFTHFKKEIQRKFKLVEYGTAMSVILAMEPFRR